MRKQLHLLAQKKKRKSEFLCKHLIELKFSGRTIVVLKGDFWGCSVTSSLVAEPARPSLKTEVVLIESSSVRKNFFKGKLKKKIKTLKI